VTRHKVQRHIDGTPMDWDRCDWEVVPTDQLFPRRCKRPRKRGYVFCPQHIKIAKERNVAAS
jgi:hypothetical protein